MTLNEAFFYKRGELHCESVPLREIGEACGTPTYIYSKARITRNVERLRTAFRAFETDIHYSLKANANLAVIRHLYDLGLGMDAVSGGEIFRAIQAGVPASEIVFAGVGKTPHELRYALEVGVGWFNVESVEELDLLNELAAEMGKVPNIALRLNPEVEAKTNKHIATGHGGAKFGIGADDMRIILSRKGDYSALKIEALHVHIGSQLGDVEETVEAVSRAQALLAPYPEMKTLNIGGGFPVNYTGAEKYPVPQDFAEALKPHLIGWKIKLEPGRYIIADSGVLLMSVIYHKQQGDQNYMIVDGSMTELLRPALYDAVHPLHPVGEASGRQTYTVAGPVCESADILGRGVRLPKIENGGLLVMTMAGAYGFVMASNYNQRPRPAEVLVDGDEWRIVRRRETWDDLLLLESEL